MAMLESKIIGFHRDKPLVSYRQMKMSALRVDSPLRETNRTLFGLDSTEKRVSPLGKISLIIISFPHITLYPLEAFAVSHDAVSSKVFYRVKPYDVRGILINGSELPVDPSIFKTDRPVSMDRVLPIEIGLSKGFETEFGKGLFPRINGFDIREAVVSVDRALPIDPEFDIRQRIVSIDIPSITRDPKEVFINFSKILILGDSVVPRERRIEIASAIFDRSNTNYDAVMRGFKDAILDQRISIPEIKRVIDSFGLTDKPEISGVLIQRIEEQQPGILAKTNEILRDLRAGNITIEQALPRLEAAKITDLLPQKRLEIASEVLSAVPHKELARRVADVLDLTGKHEVAGTVSQPKILAKTAQILGDLRVGKITVEQALPRLEAAGVKKLPTAERVRIAAEVLYPRETAPKVSLPENLAIVAEILGLGGSHEAVQVPQRITPEHRKILAEAEKVIGDLRTGRITIEQALPRLEAANVRGLVSEKRLEIASEVLSAGESRPAISSHESLIPGLKEVILDRSNSLPDVKRVVEVFDLAGHRDIAGALIQRLSEENPRIVGLSNDLTDKHENLHDLQQPLSNPVIHEDLRRGPIPYSKDPVEWAKDIVKQMAIKATIITEETPKQVFAKLTVPQIKLLVLGAIQAGLELKRNKNTFAADKQASRLNGLAQRIRSAAKSVVLTASQTLNTDKTKDREIKAENDKSVSKEMNPAPSKTSYAQPVDPEAKKIDEALDDLFRDEKRTNDYLANGIFLNSQLQQIEASVGEIKNILLSIAMDSKEIGIIFKAMADSHNAKRTAELLSLLLSGGLPQTAVTAIQEYLINKSGNSRPVMMKEFEQPETIVETHNKKDSNPQNGRQR